MGKLHGFPDHGYGVQARSIRAKGQDMVSRSVDDQLILVVRQGPGYLFCFYVSRDLDGPHRPLKIHEIGMKYSVQCNSYLARRRVTTTLLGGWWRSATSERHANNLPSRKMTRSHPFVVIAAVVFGTLIRVKGSSLGARHGCSNRPEQGKDNLGHHYCMVNRASFVLLQATSCTWLFYPCYMVLPYIGPMA